MSKGLLIFLSLAILCTTSIFANERKTLLPADKNYLVSQKEATKILINLKNKADYDPAKKRPKLTGKPAIDNSEDQQLRSCWADEDQFFKEIQGPLLNSWAKAWRNKDDSKFKQLLHRKAKLDKFAISFKGEPEKLGDIDFYQKWGELSEGGSVKEYLTQYEKVESLELVTIKYTANHKDRDSKLNMQRAELQVLYDLRGITKKGERRNDRGPIKVTVVKHDNKWKIVEIKNWGLETTLKKEAGFQETTKVSGVMAMPEYQRSEAIRRGGYGIAIGDYNNDGIQDLYLGAYGPGKIMTGSKDGVFTEDKLAGLGEDTLVKAAVFADLNNDGNTDLLLTRFVPTDIRRSSFQNDIVIYKNTGGGKFKKIEGHTENRTKSFNAMPATVGDFNNDGLLDFYVGFPGTKDFTVLGKLPDKEGIRAQGVYLNLGNFKFTENDLGEYGPGHTDKISAQQRIYPHSSVALDFDQDGDTDIMVIDDRGNISPAYQNTGNGTFVQAQQRIGIDTAGNGMGMAAADIDNNGILDMVLSKANFTPLIRADQSCKSNWDNKIFDKNDYGLNFYYGMKKGQYADATLKNGLSYAGEGLAGLEFIDYNNDGFQDLFISNGLWTGTNPDQDLTHTFARASVFHDDHVLQDLHSGTPQDETRSDFMKVLSGFKGDIYTNKAGKDRPHMAGFQRKRLFRNTGDGSFIEVGYVEGVDSLADGYVVTKSDIDGDGRLDLILRNGDPGSVDVNFPSVQVFKNKNKENNKSVRLKLVGNKSNKNAIGASVVFTTESSTQYQQLIANNGAAQSEAIMHFGLGGNKVAKKIVISWPSGLTTVLTDVQPGLHVVEESAEKISYLGK